MSMDEKTRCGVVALLGLPNAGKSTLLNRLVGQKIAIVSPKAQTTRTRTLGVVNHKGAQILFHDTPGLLAPKRTLEKTMMHAASASADEADVICLLVDATDKNPAEALSQLARVKARVPVWLLLNKVDALRDKAALLPLAAALSEKQTFTETFMLSGARGEGLEVFLDKLAATLPESPWHYDADTLTDVPQKALAAEITREQLYLQLGQELPYAATVITDAWESFDNGTAKITQSILVEKDGQKAIVIGKGGAKLKAIGAAARAEMKSAFGFAVHLFLHVKVKADWQEKSEFVSGVN